MANLEVQRPQQLLHLLLRHCEQRECVDHASRLKAGSEGLPHRRIAVQRQRQQRQAELGERAGANSPGDGREDRPGDCIGPPSGPEPLRPRLALMQPCQPT